MVSGSVVFRDYFRGYEAARLVFGPRVQRGANFSRSSLKAGGEADLSADPRGSRARDEVDGICHQHASVQRSLHAGALLHPARSTVPAFESAEDGRRRLRSRLQHRRVVHHEHQLAELRGRDHHELLHADGWPRVPQLHVGGSRHCFGHRIHSRDRPPRKRDPRQFLGGYDSGHTVDSAAALHRVLSCLGFARRGAKSQAV